MKNRFIKKSHIILALLIVGSVLQYAIFRMSTGTILFFLLTIITLIHIGIKALKERYPNKLIKLISMLFRWGLLSLGILSLVITFFMLGSIDQCRTLTHTPASGERVMIILGAGLKGEEVSQRLKLRLDRGLELLKQRPYIPVIVSGGQGPDEIISEAEAMKRYLVENGIEEGRILKEDQSTSTLQNLIFSKKIANDSKLINQAIIVTSDFHMFRSLFIAKKVGWEAIGACNESEIYILSNYTIREIPAVMIDLFRTQLL